MRDLDQTTLAVMDTWLGNGVDHDERRVALHGLADTLRDVAADLVRIDAEAADPAALAAAGEAALRLREAVGSLPLVATTPARAPMPVGYLSERSPVTGRANPVAPPLRVTFGNPTTAEVVYTEQYEGPAGGVHGGVIAASFDEVLGVAQMAAGVAGYTGTLTIRYRAITPLHVPITIEAGVERIEGSRLSMWARSSADGTPCAEATGVFIAKEQLPVPQPTV